ncbi:HAD-IA family hydrolase [Streptomyces sp. NPDC050549]|uniref:HAD-IA family hydrolase n=1 Tax=Streptomyces sp. NPDC050549 TaxID=3155406 RepID=UPI00343F7EF6
MVNSSLIGREKPHRRIFETALDLAGRPERVWMVGDNPVADIAGAEGPRIPGILVDPPREGLRAAVRRILDGDVASMRTPSPPTTG